MSTILNKNFRVKVGRFLVGYAGMCRLLGQRRADMIICKALRCRDDVFRYKCTKENVVVSLYVR